MQRWKGKVRNFNEGENLTGLKGKEGENCAMSFLPPFEVARIGTNRAGRRAGKCKVGRNEEGGTEEVRGGCTVV